MNTTQSQQVRDRTHVEQLRVGLVGARGHTGTEFLALLDAHDKLLLSHASSRMHANATVASVYENLDTDVVFEDASPADVASWDDDVVILALPNGVGQTYVDAIDHSPVQPQLILDLSADQRFDDHWCYGLPECNAKSIAGATRIANPGCYATAMMLSMLPLVDDLNGTSHAFGVSGYSGAGTSPSPRNDLNVLRDCVIPYALCDHVHEREVSRHLKHTVRFSPHVASFFRGISMTMQVSLREPIDVSALQQRFAAYYSDSPFVHVQDDVPIVSSVTESPLAHIGGFTVQENDQRHVGLVCVLDNLTKGAASQAMQNINLALGFGTTEGILK